MDAFVDVVEHLQIEHCLHKLDLSDFVGLLTLVFGKQRIEFLKLRGKVGGACFVGTEGRIAVDREALVSCPADIVREPLKPDEVHLYLSNRHADNFLECIRTRKQPICDANVSHRAASALLLGGGVKQLKRTLKWDPQAEQFVNDDEANRMLSIAKRPPWCI